MIRVSNIVKYHGTLRVLDGICVELARCCAASTGWNNSKQVKSSSAKPIWVAPVSRPVRAWSTGLETGATRKF